MKKALVLLICAGSMFLAMGQHPFVTNGAVILKDREVEVELSMWTGFYSEGAAGYGNVGVNTSYGAGDRFQVGMGNYWYARKSDHSDNGLTTPDVYMKFSVRPDLFTIKAFSLLNAEEFGAAFLYSYGLKKLEINTNLDLGFVSENGEDNAFTWAYSVVKPLNNWFFGAEIYGKAAGWMEKDAKKPFWQVGYGYTFPKRNSHTASLGFGGSFVSNNDLKITLAMTWLGSGNK